MVIDAVPLLIRSAGVKNYLYHWIEHLRRILAERGSVRFSELFESASSRSEVICTFLALLELIRLKQLVCVQPEPFAEIEIRCAENSVQPSSDGSTHPTQQSTDTVNAGQASSLSQT